MINKITKTVSFEDELDTIRLSIYNEIKDMTPEEIGVYFHEQAEPVMKQFNLKYSTLLPVKPAKRERVAV